MKYIKTKEYVAKIKHLRIKTRNKFNNPIKEEKESTEDNSDSANQYAADNMAQGAEKYSKKATCATTRNSKRVRRAYKIYKNQKSKKGMNELKKTGTKASEKTIRTASKSVKSSVKTTQKTTRAMIKNTKAMVKSSIKAAKLTVKGVIATVKSLIAAIKVISAAIAAGGWAAVIIILIVCFVAFVIAGTLGAFDLNEGDNSGISPETVLEELIEDYRREVEQEVEAINSEEIIKIPDEGFDLINKENVIAVFKARVIYENWSMMDKIRMDHINTKILEDTLRKMYQVELTQKQHEEQEENTEIILEIRITKLLLEEIFQKFKFDEYQREIFDLFLNIP